MATKAYRLPPLVPLTVAIESGLWPTPDASVMNDGESLDTWTARREREKAKHRNGNGFGMPLAIAARMWPTPTVGDSKNAANKTASRSDPNSKHHDGTTLVDAVRMWPTPTVPNGGRSPRGGMSPTGMTPDGKKRQVDLAYAVKMWPTPTSRDWTDGSAQACANVPVNALLGRVVHRWATPRTADAKGQRMSRARQDKPDNLGSQVGGALSPTWVEWLMGFPLGWTALDASEMQSCLSARRSSGKRSSKRSVPDE